MATLKDISKKTGLSVAQVSRALNGYADVSAKTRARVQAAADALSYAPNLSARRLVTGKSNNVGFVKRHHDQLAQDMTFLESLVGLTRACSKHDLQLSFHLVEDDGNILDAFSRLHDSGGIGGFIITEPRRNDARIRHLLARNIPFVVHGKDPDQSGYAYVDIDNFRVGYELTQNLILQGHRRIALINGVADRDFSESRLRGHKQALEDFSLAFDEDLVQNGFMTIEHGQNAALKFMRFMDEPPSAMICGNMLVAKGVYEALSLLGLKIPDDVSIVAHDDAHLLFDKLEFAPSLSVTRSPVADAFAPLAEFLSRQMSGADASSCQKLMPFEFAARHSVKFVS